MTDPVIAQGAAPAAPAPAAGATPPASAAPAGAPPAAGAPAAPAPSATAWWQGPDFTPEEQQWLQAKGLTEDDPLKVLPKIAKGHRAAEQRIGKGLDSIMDRPAKDQPVHEWLRANAATLGLPDKPDGYTTAPPEGWPKDAKWDAEFEADARKVAFDMGVPPKAYEAFVGLYAKKVAALTQAADQGVAQAREGMMQQLSRDFGDKTPAVITRAQQGFQWLAEKAGLGQDQLTAAAQTLTDKLGDGKTPGSGDANVIRLFAAMADALGEDTAVALGRGGPLTDTPADARAKLQAFMAPDGEWAKAAAAQDAATIARLRPTFEHLSKLAARR